MTIGGFTTIATGFVGVSNGSLLWAPASIAFGYFTAAIVLMVGIKTMGAAE